ncbi:conserved exported hypothetical protein [Candidatus Sulfopaludibacter sp. SbA6]|nr:conserved exported hypothetical protein [Candidatus Sulfopaludibacter sp. SbA6]
MKRTISAVIAASITLTAAFAGPSQVGARRENQQDRIAQGVKSGSLTAAGTANLEKKESAINKEIRTDRSLNGGKLTSQERKTVNGQQNKMSNQIYRDKHNAATQHYGNNEVDSRRYNQQQRIANGIASGKLTAGQTARLEKGESAINQETRTDRTLNGGSLTPGEKAAINGQQDVASGNIYRDKHN